MYQQVEFFSLSLFPPCIFSCSFMLSSFSTHTRVVLLCGRSSSPPLQTNSCWLNFISLFLKKLTAFSSFFYEVLSAFESHVGSEWHVFLFFDPLAGGLEVNRQITNNLESWHQQYICFSRKLIYFDRLKLAACVCVPNLCNGYTAKVFFEVESLIDGWIAQRRWKKIRCSFLSVEL